MEKYKELEIWELAMEITTDIYELTKKYPKEEIYTLTNHTRKTALSLPSNIAEGRGRKSDTEFNRFLNITIGSAYELGTQLDLAYRLKYLSKATYEEISDKITRLIKRTQTLQNKLEV